MKRRVDRLIRVLIAANILLVAGLAAVLLVSIIRQPAGHPAQAGAAPELPASSAEASATPELMPMGLAHIPTNNACVLCHEAGGSKGIKVVPAVVHPLEGWRQCLTCHTNETLGRLAPGHTGISEVECLNCHKAAPEGPSITQPHSQLQDQLCLDCHGTYAHLPSSMASRNESTCTLCHKPTAIAPPEYPHQKDARLGCRSCHDSPEVGNLPIDHALRTDSTCQLCHNIITIDASGHPGASRPPASPPAAPATAIPSATDLPAPTIPDATPEP